MADFATLGIKIDSADIKKASILLAELAREAKVAEQSASSASRGLKEAASGTQELGSAADGATKSVRSLSDAFLTGFVRGAAAAAIAGLAKSFLDITSDVARFDETARRAGVSLQQFQELRIGFAASGVSGPEFDKGIGSLAASLNEARQTENDLTKLLDDNNVRYKDRNGQIISTNAALEIAAQLIQNAATEQDKIKIAEAFSLPESFISTLERGIEGLRKAGDVGRESGGIIDAELVAKAKAFDDAWNSTWASWGAYAKASILSAGQGISSLIQRWEVFASSINPYRTFLGEKEGEKEEAPPLVINVNKPRRPTIIGAPTPRGGGGGGRASESEEAETAYERETAAIERQIRVIERQNQVINATTFEKNKSEAASRLLEAAMRDEEPITATLTEKINEQAAALAVAKEKQDELTKAQQDSRAMTQLVGTSISGFFSDIISGGKNASDALMNFAKRISDAAIQGALLGNGPFGKFFGGTKEGGGLIDQALKYFGLGFADGGAFGGGGVQAFANGGTFTNSVVGSPTLFKFANGTGMMGEAGPEAIMPLERDGSGRLGVNASGVGGRSGGGGTVVNIFNNSDATAKKQERRGEDGSTIIDVIIDKVSESMMTPGSSTYRALQSVTGVRTSLTGR
jgi:hypothetical protein